MDKTHVLPLSCKNTNICSTQNKQNGIAFIVNAIKNIKCLGVSISDTRLKWDNHIKFVINKLQAISYKVKYLPE